MAEAVENAKIDKTLVRTSTVAKINQFMQDHAIGDHDDLDIVTFIFAAQAIKPGADQEELMQIFSEAQEEEDADTATKMHKLLKRVSVVDTSADSEGLLGDGAINPIFSHSVGDPPSDSEDSARPRGHSRRRSVYQQAEIDATESMARTAQKLDIAAEMIHLGHSADTVASVTGLEMESINAILNAVQFSPRKVTHLSPDQIAELIRLCTEGPKTVAAESVLAHKLLVAMKDQVLLMADNKAMVSFESTFSEMATAKSKEVYTNEPLPGLAEDGGEVDPDDSLPTSLSHAATGPGAAIQKEAVSAVYELAFTEKPLGMSWNQTSDGKNLYVQDVLQGGLAQRLGVLVGSVINSFNGEQVYGKGPEQIYMKFKSCNLPIKIGFRRPVATSASDPNVIMLKEVTGLETETVIKLLHKFGGNVQAANEAFYIAKARTRQWISKQKDQTKEGEGAPKAAASGKSKKSSKKKRNWWKKWTKTAVKN